MPPTPPPQVDDEEALSGDGLRPKADTNPKDSNKKVTMEDPLAFEPFSAETIPDRDDNFDPFNLNLSTASAITAAPTFNPSSGLSGGLSGGVSSTGNVMAKLSRIRAGRTSGRTGRHSRRKSSNSPSDNKYPQDCYSFIALHGPRENLPFFLFGLLPLIFQIIFLLLLIWSETDELRGTIGETDNPDSGTGGPLGDLASFIPANASPIIRTTQVVAIAAYVIFPDSSLKDIVRSVQTFPVPSRVKKGDPVGKMRLACVLRGIQGALAMFVTLLLVMTSDAVVDIILNFTAVNFISTLDDYAFSLALDGEFGPALQSESERIAKKDLPSCMKMEKASKHWYNVVISSILCVILFAMMTFVFLSQNSNMVWVTRTFRVQFQGSTGLNEYSGCFEINENPKSISFQRRSYNSLDGNASFAYCRKHRQWILLDGDEGISDPCQVRDENVELSRSAKTDAFDIRTSFDDSWVSSTNTPLDMYFFESGRKEDLFCQLTLGDGICNRELNKLGFRYDGGDCCSATCEGANCGRNPATVFGKSSTSFTDFPICSDRTMVPITIRVDGIQSSRDEEFAPSTVIDELPFRERPFGFNDPTGESVWRNAAPVNPYLLLNCDGKEVLFAYIEESMVNQTHTVKVNDGANCTVQVQNMTANESIATDEPIWFVNYTLFHGEEMESKTPIEILSQQSHRQEMVHFKRIPECYFADLEGYDYVNTPYIYAGLDWVTVLEDTFEDNSECGERFALINMAFAMNGTDLIAKSQNQCRSPDIVCSDEKVTYIDWSYKNLNGEIPNEVILLENLEVLKMNGNKIASISNEIGRMNNLREIDLSLNDLSYIPTEIESLVSLQTLRLDDNQLSYIPTEIGKLTDLEELGFGANDFNFDSGYFTTETGTFVPSDLTTGTGTFVPSGVVEDSLVSIPTEIWQLTKLQILRLHENDLPSLPTEIGGLTNLQSLDLYSNDLSSIPTEIGLLTNLTSIRLDENDISSLPTEIMQLVSLRTIDLYGNNLVNFPTEITKLASLEDLLLHMNKISSIPKEIGELTSLKNLRLDQNVDISSIPTEIGHLSNLEILFFDGTSVKSIPTEIGELVQLTNLDLSRNGFSSIPTNIGQLTRLERLAIDANELTSLPTEIGQLHLLKNLHLANNELLSIPREIQRLSSLQILDLYRNNLTAIPLEIGQLSNLQNLRLPDNQLSSVPTIIGLLTSLQNLQLNDNQLSFIPEEIGKLTNLDKLDIDGNQLQSIPSVIGQLTGLQVLRIDRNQLSSVPGEIGKLSELHDLDLGENQLSILPMGIWTLTNLEMLRLDGNRLKTLPSEIGQLSSLERLYIDNNDITSLPSEIALLTNLQSFYYGGNNITDFPQELVELCSNIYCSD